MCCPADACRCCYLCAVHGMACPSPPPPPLPPPTTTPTHPAHIPNPIRTPTHAPPHYYLLLALPCLKAAAASIMPGSLACCRSAAQPRSWPSPTPGEEPATPVHCECCCSTCDGWQQAVEAWRACHAGAREIRCAASVCTAPTSASAKKTCHAMVCSECALVWLCYSKFASLRSPCTAPAHAPAACLVACWPCSQTGCLALQSWPLCLVCHTRWQLCCTAHSVACCPLSQGHRHQRCREGKHPVCDSGRQQ
jgi:hypothetical protein